jgi:hypothetical protein
MVVLFALAFGFRGADPYMRGMRRGLILLTVLAALGGAVAAQEVAVVEGEAVATDGTELSVIERWEADHTTIFDASEIVLADLLYVARPVIVFADNPNQPEFRQQMQLFQADLAGLDIRDVILIVDTDPAARSAIRQELRPRGFNLVLIDKDGRVNLRKPEPWDVREISRQIDKMPLRLQEIREGL